MPAHRKYNDPPLDASFGLWTVIGETVVQKGKRRTLCRCACGLERDVVLSTLIAGQSQNCRHCTSKRRGKAYTVRQFWKKVKKTKHCWLWTGALTSKGYGNFWDGDRNRPAHAFAWELENGRGLTHQGNHTCDNPKCVRPEHVYDGTQQQNLQDASKRGRLRR